jgi:SsrA-binding protein
MNIVAKNKKAFFDYEISQRLEAGLVLTGDEVKSLRAKRVSLVGTFATVKDGELYLLNCNINAYDNAYIKDKDAATRTRKLLLHRKQLNKIIGDISEKGVTILALSIYFNAKNIAKVELGVGRHKKAAGKKQALKEQDIKRDTMREMKKYK